MNPPPLQPDVPDNTTVWIAPAGLGSPFSDAAFSGLSNLKLSAQNKLTMIRIDGIDLGLTADQAFPYDLWLYLNFVWPSFPQLVDKGHSVSDWLTTTFGAQIGPHGGKSGPVDMTSPGITDVYDLTRDCFAEPSPDLPHGLNAVRTSMVGARNALTQMWHDIGASLVQVFGSNPIKDQHDPAGSDWAGAGADSFVGYLSKMDGVISQLSDDMAAVIDQLHVVAVGLEDGKRETWRIYGQEIVDSAIDIVNDVESINSGYARTDPSTGMPEPVSLSLDVKRDRLAAATQAKAALGGLEADINTALNTLTPLGGAPISVPTPDPSALDLDTSPSDGPGTGNDGTHSGSTALQGSPNLGNSGQPPAPTTLPAGTSTTSAGMPLPLSGSAVPGDPETQNASAATASRAARLRSLTVRVGNTTVTVPDEQVSAGDANPDTKAGDVTIQDDGVTVTVHQGRPQAAGTDTTAGPGPVATGPGTSAPADSGQVFTAEPGGVPPEDVHQLLADPSLAGTTTTDVPLAAQPGQVDPTITAEPVSVSDSSGTFTLTHQQGTYQVGDMTVHDAIDATGAETVTIDSPDGTTVTITDQVDPSTLVSGGGAVPSGGEQVTGPPPGQFVDWSQATGADPTAIANALAADGIDPRAYLAGTDPTQAVPPATIDPSQVDPTAGTDNPGAV